MKPQLLYTSGNPDYIHLYTIHVSATPLSMFEDLAVTRPVPQSLCVETIAVPYRPFETLQNSLTARRVAIAPVNPYRLPERLPYPIQESEG